MYKVIKYVNKSGACPVDDFIKELIENNREKELDQIVVSIKLLEQYGFLLPQKIKHMRNT